MTQDPEHQIGCDEFPFRHKPEGTENDVHVVGSSSSMAQGQTLMSQSQSSGRMLEDGVTRANDAQTVLLAQTTEGINKMLSQPQDLATRLEMGSDLKIPKILSNKRLYRILSEMNAAMNK